MRIFETIHPNGVREVLTDGEDFAGKMTCGQCGRSWDDDHASDITPTPGGRCPFEYDHVYEDDEDEHEVLTRLELDPADIRRVLNGVRLLLIENQEANNYDGADEETAALRALHHRIDIA